MRWRLSTVAPEFVEQLHRESQLRLREIAERQARAALRATGLTDDRVEHALSALERREYGDSETRAALKEFVDELDERAWDIRDRVDARTAKLDEYVRAFREARAANSLWFALDPDPTTAAMEAAYEARAAEDHEGEPVNRAADIAKPS